MQALAGVTTVNTRLPLQSHHFPRKLSLRAIYSCFGTNIWLRSYIQHELDFSSLIVNPREVSHTRHGGSGGSQHKYQNTKLFHRLLTLQQYLMTFFLEALAWGNISVKTVYICMHIWLYCIALLFIAGGFSIFLLISDWCYVDGISSGMWLPL